MNKLLNYIIIGLLFVGFSLIIWFIIQFNELVKYRECMDKPVTDVPAWCLEEIK